MELDSFLNSDIIYIEKKTYGQNLVIRSQCSNHILVIKLKFIPFTTLT